MEVKENSPKTFISVKKMEVIHNEVLVNVMNMKNKY